MIKSIVLCTALLSTGCIVGSDTEIIHYTDMITLDFNIGSIVNNECIDNYVDAFPVTPRDDNFYLIESPEQIDSVLNVYYEFEWSPRLEEFFPENGMLLVYLQNTNLEDGYEGHSCKLYDRTIYIDLVINKYIGDETISPGIRSIIVPIGIIPAVSL